MSSKNPIICVLILTTNNYTKCVNERELSTLLKDKFITSMPTDTKKTSPTNTPQSKITQTDSMQRPFYNQVWRGGR